MATDTRTTAEAQTDKDARIAELENRVKQLEERLDTTDDNDCDDGGQDGVSRRAVLSALTGTGILGLSAGGLFASSASGATAPGYTETGELRDGNGDAVAILNNGGPIEYPMGVGLEWTTDQRNIHYEVQSREFDKNVNPADAQWYDLLTVGTISSGEVLVGSADGSSFENGGVIKAYWAAPGDINDIINTVEEKVVSSGEGFSLRWSGETLQIQGDTEFINTFVASVRALGTNITWNW